MIKVLTQVVPKLPNEEKYDLADQMRRACKSAPAQLAEGYAKKNYKRSWKKYIDDAIGECNEMIHHLSTCRDVCSMIFQDVLVEQVNAKAKHLYISKGYILCIFVIR